MSYAPLLDEPHLRLRVLIRIRRIVASGELGEKQLGRDRGPRKTYAGSQALTRLGQYAERRDGMRCEAERLSGLTSG